MAFETLQRLGIFVVLLGISADSLFGPAAGSVGFFAATAGGIVGGIGFLFAFLDGVERAD